MNHPLRKADAVSIALFTGLVCLFILISGCSALVKKATQPLIDNLSASIMRQQDLELVRDGAPAYLLLIDGMLEGSPNDPDTLMAAAQLYSAYTSAFVIDEDKERAKILSEKAKNYAFTAMSIKNGTFAALHDKPFAEFEAVLPTIQPGDEEILFLVISTWSTYIQAHSGDWDNLADIAKVEALVKRLLDLDETYYYGSPHLAMGILKTLLPKALGGRPEEAKVHFEKAIELSEGKFLPVQVTFAQRYARLTFDRDLHDRLLNQVMETPVDIVPELTLINAMAKKQAAALLADADDYF